MPSELRCFSLVVESGTTDLHAITYEGMYKVEPVVADGGQVVLYAPQVTEVSRTHGTAIAGVGYHCRDYFVRHWDRFKDLPWGVLAHSPHLRGSGSYDEATGEHCRIEVTLPTGINAKTTRALGLSYLDPGSIDIAEWQRDPGTLVVPDVGEILYKLH